MRNKIDPSFLYEMSHEIKTPLTNIKGYSKLLYAGEFGKLTKEQKDYIKTIMNEAEKSLLATQKMLDGIKK